MPTLCVVCSICVSMDGISLEDYSIFVILCSIPSKFIVFVSYVHIFPLSFIVFFPVFRNWVGVVYISISESICFHIPNTSAMAMTSNGCNNSNNITATTTTTTEHDRRKMIWHNSSTKAQTLELKTRNSKWFLVAFGNHLFPMIFGSGNFLFPSHFSQFQFVFIWLLFSELLWGDTWNRKQNKYRLFSIFRTRPYVVWCNGNFFGIDASERIKTIDTNIRLCPDRKRVDVISTEGLHWHFLLFDRVFFYPFCKFLCILFITCMRYDRQTCSVGVFSHVIFDLQVLPLLLRPAQAKSTEQNRNKNILQFSQSVYLTPLHFLQFCCLLPNSK